MNTELTLALLPLLVLAVGAVVTLLALTIHRSHAAVASSTTLTFACTVASLPLAARAVPLETMLLGIDSLSLIYLGAIAAAACCVSIISYSYLDRQQGVVEEYYLLLELGTFGAAILAVSKHFVTLFLGLEILSVALYGLIAYARRARGLLAGIKYLVSAGVASALLLFGIALIYAATGRLQVAPAFEDSPSIVALGGLTLVIVAMSFKLALVPFHMWTPDIYGAAPAPVAAFIATVSKGAVLLAFLQVAPLWHQHPPLRWVLTISAAASMLLGNLLALRQDNIRRLLAYSSIAHVGYFMVGLIGLPAMGVEAVSVYFVGYAASILLAFCVLTVLSPAETVEDIRGLCTQQPLIGGAFVVALLSLAGLPLTAGFIGKFYILASGVGDAQWALVLTLIASSVLSLSYYLRVVLASLSPASARETAPVSRVARSLVGLLSLVVIGLGAWPYPLQALTHGAIAARRAPTPQRAPSDLSTSARLPDG